tara:strand:+ start:223 stop:414 length:192 start_codon:yes stop_codon:yes gene_type:complete
VKNGAQYGLAAFDLLYGRKDGEKSFYAAAFNVCCLQENFAAEQNTVMLTFKCHNIATENKVSP